MSRNWVTYFGISLALFCCTAAKLSGGPDMIAQPRGYRGLSELEITQRRFDQMIEQRDISVAIRVLRGEGFTSDEIRDAVQNRNVRIDSVAGNRITWPGHYASATGNVGGEGIEGAAGILVGPTYYLIVGRARLLRGFRQ